jgi:PAS domain S-box-containing protein
VEKSSIKSRRSKDSDSLSSIGISTSPCPRVSKAKLEQENENLRAQFTEAQETLRAIHEGEIDAIVVSGSRGEQVFSLTGVESVYRLIVETMKEMALTVAFDGTILFANAQFAQCLKRPMEEILGHPLHEFVITEHQAEVDLLLSISKNEPTKNRLVFKRADDWVLPAYVSSSLLNRSEAGSICIVAMDLTELEDSTHLIQELRRQEDVLRASEERFRSVLDSSLDAIYRLNLKTGRYDYFSPACLSVYGFSPEEMLEMNEEQALARLHPEDRPEVNELLKRMLSTGRAELEFRWKNKAGDYRWLSAFVTLVRDATGQPVYRNGVTRDISGRKRIEEAMSLVARKYSAMFNTTSDGVWLHNYDGIILEVNDAYCRMSGYSRSELIGMPVNRLEANESPAEVTAHLHKLLDQSGHERFQSRHRRKDGSVFNVDVTALKMDMEEGRIAIFVRDITEQKQLMNALQLQSREQETILDSTQALIFYKDNGNRLLRVNKAFEEAVGLTKEKLVGRRLDEVFPKEQVEAFWRDDLEVIKSGKAKRGIVEKVETLSGTRIVQTDKFPYHDEQGKIEGVVGFSVDVTDLKRTEEALRRSAARLQLLSNCSSRLLASQDPQSVVNELCREVMAHLDCQAFFHFMADSRIGKLHLNACAGIPAEEAQKIEWLDYGVAVCGCAAQQACRIISEDIMQVPDTRTNHVRSYGIQAYCCHPLVAQGRVIGTLSFGTTTRAHFLPDEIEVMRTVADHVAVAMQRVLNLQALKELNESLEQRVADRTAEVRQQAQKLHALAAELSQAEQRERKRLATVLHDHLQQLLVAAQMHLSLVKQADSAAIGPAIQGVESIIREAIDASRSLAIDLSPPILHQGGLGPALGWLANRMEEKSLFKVRVKADSDAEPASEPMRLLLFESVRELLLNAVKHSGTREASVTMMLAPDGWTRIAIEDSGGGFDPAAVGARRDSLGLFGIQQRLAYLGGKMEVESALGHGTRVILLAPPVRSFESMSAVEAQEMSDREFTGPREKQKKISILLVDDHRIVRQGLSSLLQLEPDFEVVAEAKDGEQALESARRYRPDVVVTDVSMPGMDGVELTRTLSREMPGIKILGLSMHIEKDVAAAMRAAGAVGYLTKGGLSENLIAAIRACMTTA